jgi:hexosaminidase
MLTSCLKTSLFDLTLTSYLTSMKRFFCLLFVVLLFVQGVVAQIHIIPQPAELKKGEGFFKLNPNSGISCPANNAETKWIADQLASQLSRVTGYKFPVLSGIMTTGLGNITMNINAVPDPKLGKEGYALKVTETITTITANTPAGIFYGVQTFKQLLPDEVEGTTVAAGIVWQAPVVEVNDQPRFGWRGLMLDVSRHFFTKEEVKRYIDDMAKYKYNVLHLHLTDDHGWRLEIKSLPKLTEVGAWNVKKTGRFGTFSKADSTEPRDYGGFYTQDDIRELVKYAKERFVNIMPEIDVPGHSLAAIAAYPDLVATPGKYYVSSGEKFMEWPPKGHFYGLIDNTLSPAREGVYTFLDKVFTEVAQLFPFEYIHMGGDETARNFWEKSAEIKALMQREKLKNLDEVQAYFVGRVYKIITSKGKKMIGWDEILDGGLIPGAAVMNWRSAQAGVTGISGGAKAAKMGHEVVMTPQDFVYLDYMQGDEIMEPKVYASLRMKKAYAFEPLPAGVDEKFIKGGQGNLWTEQVYNQRQLQYMTWPRAFAISEAVWSPRSVKNWPGFVERVEDHMNRLQIAGTKYAPSIYEPDIKAVKSGSGMKVQLVPEIDGLDLHYSFDNSYPDNYYPKYSSAVDVPKDAETLRVVSYRNGKQVGRFMTITVADLKKRAGIK